jgi:hypothetical protein
MPTSRKSARIGSCWVRRGIIVRAPTASPVAEEMSATSLGIEMAESVPAVGTNNFTSEDGSRTLCTAHE